MSQPATLAFPTPSQPSADPIGELGEEIAELSAQIQVAIFHFLCLVRRFDDLEGGASLGFKSTAHWLAWRTGIRLSSAREKVRVARALADLPAISDALSQGQVSYSKVRAMTRVASPANEEELLHFAKAGTTAHLERLVRCWRRADRQEEERDELARLAARHLDVWTTDDGMVEVRGRLDPEAGAALLRALEAAEDLLYAKGRSADEAEGSSPAADEVPAPQRRADALGRMAEAALAGGLDRGTRGDRYQVVVHVDADVLADPDQPGASLLEDGRGGATSVSAETSRRIACDCSRVDLVEDAEGRVLDVGRRTRTIPPSIRRALLARDRTCRFPGCGSTFCEAHHIEHWANGGETRLGNLVLLCRHHHRVVHEGGFRVEVGVDGGLVFRDREGRPFLDAPVAPTLHELGLEALWGRLDRDSRRPESIDLEATIPSWSRQDGPVDWVGAVEWLRGLGVEGCSGDVSAEASARITTPRCPSSP